MIVWDASLIGAKQAGEAVADGPPELSLTHGFKTDKVSDFGRESGSELSEDNIDHPCHPGENIYYQESLREIVDIMTREDLRVDLNLSATKLATLYLIFPLG